MGRHYTGALGFNPVFAFVGRNGVALNSLLRPGNQKDSSGLEDFLQETLELLPAALRPRLLARFDSGFYSRRNITTLLRHETDFVVKARLCDVLRTAVTEELEAGRIVVEPMPYGGDVYGEFSYQPEGWPQPLRYCFCLQIEEKEQDGQLLLIPKRQDLILATTLTAEEATARQVFEAYRRRGRAEQFIKTEKRDGFIFAEKRDGFIFERERARARHSRTLRSTRLALPNSILLAASLSRSMSIFSANTIAALAVSGFQVAKL